MRAWKTPAASPVRQEALESPPPVWHIVPMHADELKQLLHASPFLPFKIFLPSEKSFAVPRQDFAWLTPKGRTLVVAVADKEAVDLLDVAMIAHVEIQETPQLN